jgi:phage-related protein (TIGR01555 family)
MSVIEAVIRECNSYFKEQNVIFELLDEAKVDIWKIKGFNASVLSQIARGQTSSRIQLAQMMKNFLNAVTLDKEDDYEQKQITFGGLSEIMEQLRIGLSAAIRLPESKIFGLSASGFASGEDSLEMYASIVEIQREKAEDVLEVIIPCCMMSLWGFIPDDWQIEWSPVRTLSAEQTEIIKNAKFARTMQMVQAGLLTPQEFMEYCQEEEIYQGESEVLKGAEPIPLMGAMGDEESLKEPASKPEKDDNGKENNKLRQNKSLLLNKS